MRGAVTVAVGLAVTVLAACGGGSDRDGSGGPWTGGGSAAQYAGRCAPDNTLAHTANGQLKRGFMRGTLADERNWAHATMDAAYLWFQEIPQVDASAAPYNVSPAEVALDNYFMALRTPAITASGKRKDAYSFTMPTDDWNAMIEDGVVAGFGFELSVLANRAPRDLRVAYTQPGSPAAAAGVERGDRLLTATVGGRDIDVINTTHQPDIDTLNRLISGPQTGEQVRFRWRRVNGGEYDAILVAGAIVTQPVLQSKVITRPDARRVGYLLFNDFMTPAEGQLYAAFRSFAETGVDDLVLDMRYNGGGYIYIASQLAWMIAGHQTPGSDITRGKTFERLVYNSKRGSGGVQPFRSTAMGRSGSGIAPGTALPALNLKRVTVLTTPNTCSASESVINGLRGVDVEVVLVGGETCGKPYGFTAKNNCGLSYFPVEFQGQNHKGFGDFADGFAPGCRVADDLSRPLGDEAEGMLAAALAWPSTQACAAAAVTAKSQDGGGDSGMLIRLPARSGKWL